MGIGSLLPVIAGAINLVSVAPRIRFLIKKPEEAARECFWRASLPALANMIYVAYGMANDLSSLAVMCAIGAVLHATIVYFIVSAQHGDKAGMSRRSIRH